MNAVEKELTAIGFGRARREPACWRAVRLALPEAADTADQSGPEASCSRALLRWRDLLRQEPHPCPYRISRTSD